VSTEPRTAQPGNSTLATPLPLVSVIVPAYNARRFILDALRSVLAQDYEPLEILLVDDGSTDGTAELVRRELPQVQIIQQPNAGAAAARNTGLAHARGELICLLDADDGWLPGKLKAQVSYLEQNPETGLVYHAWFVWRPNDRGEYVWPDEVPSSATGRIDRSKSGWIYTSLLLDCIVHTCTVMIRRSVVEQVGAFDTGLTRGEDYDYWLRVSRVCEMHKLAGTYSFYRAVSNSLTNRSPGTRNHEYEVVSSAISRWGVAAQNGDTLPARMVRRRLAKLAFDFGYAHYHDGFPEVAAAAFSAAWRHDPLRWRALLYLIRVKTLEASWTRRSR
jgi:glycosyltransferase involved in cell wall biosynthesis